ncbi:MAG: hypothetical protein KatS3mg056_3041 [Chloroflexus sp.]|nr:MAG: hypothetical protein KatS3mg056_3041 [Chloroflexus sp.]
MKCSLNSWISIRQNVTNWRAIITPTTGNNPDLLFIINQPERDVMRFGEAMKAIDDNFNQGVTVECRGETLRNVVERLQLQCSLIGCC